METLEIARTIQQQLNTIVLMAIGARSFVALPQTGYRRGGLAFQASFFGKARCQVIIELTGMDLYHVQLLSPISKNLIKDLGSDIDCEMLTDTVEGAVEEFFKTHGVERCY
jgi:hypothetical protein